MMQLRVHVCINAALEQRMMLCNNITNVFPKIHEHSLIGLPYTTQPFGLSNKQGN